MNYQYFVLIIVALCLLTSCSTAYQTFTYKEQPKPADSLEIREGILNTAAQRIKYKRKGKTLAIVELSAPVMVAQAEQEEKWGFFQFPSIGRASDSTLIVSWNMREDSHKAYGTKGREYTPMMSKDNGLTWMAQDKGYYAPVRGYNGLLRDGRLIQISTPQSKDIHSYVKFPKPIMKKGDRAYYREDQLPDDLQGVYITYLGEKQNSQTIHASLIDPDLLRYSIGDLFPVIWWGNIKQLSDLSLVAGVYPVVYQDSLGNIMPSAVSFYRSEDFGHSWSVIGKIPFCFDGIADIRGDKEYDEPAFEVLKDSSLICVMRTGSTSPMYKTFSSDFGKTWTNPVPFTPNGVYPILMLLKNNVLVMASGRPGVQLRFSFDGTGRTWSDPIEMIPFMNIDGTYQRDVSCGYASLLEDKDDSFYIVYSDFTTTNTEGHIRKSIWCRRIKVLGS